MYFKVSMRTNPESGLPEGYYRLVESYRNEYNRICHRTLLNIGFLRLPAEKLNAIRDLLNDRLNRRHSLFEHQQDPEVIDLANQYWDQLVAKGKVDASDQAFEKKRRMVDADTIKHKNAREVGAEWMCFQAIEQLRIRQLLENMGWHQEQIELSMIQIISRAVYPYSENRTCRWIKENSAVCEGKKSDSSSLADIVDKIRMNTAESKRAIVVLDAGIATEDNLALLQYKGYDYVCVSRTKIRQYNIDENFQPQQISIKRRQKITLEKVVSQQTTDYLLKIHSEGKQKKERSMKNQFQDRFMQEIDKARAALDRKGGIKRADKVQRRIGRIIEKYPSIAKHYQIEVKTENEIARQIELIKKDSYQEDEKHLGVYFIRTNLKAEEQSTIWQIYNSIREIESSFRSLKSELNLRPVYHKNDDSTVAHLHLGILAYWLVNTIRYQLKQKGINHSWSEIVRITNTQKVITTSGQNTFDEIISIRKCTEPNEKVKQIYNVLGYKNYPFVKRKSVVHKPELKKTNPLIYR